MQLTFVLTLPDLPGLDPEALNAILARATGPRLSGTAVPGTPQPAPAGPRAEANAAAQHLYAVVVTDQLMNLAVDLSHALSETSRDLRIRAYEADPEAALSGWADAEAPGSSGVSNPT